MTDQPMTGEQPSIPITAAVFLPYWVEPANMRDTVQALQGSGIAVVLGGAHAADLDIAGTQAMQVDSFARFLNEVWTQTRTSLLAVWDVIDIPTGFLDNAIRLLEEEPRVGSVSFFSNAGGLSRFSGLGSVDSSTQGGSDATAITRRLRDVSPQARPAALPHADGAAVLISASAMSAAGPMADPPSHLPRSSLVEFSLRCRRKGFYPVLEPSTYFFRRPSPSALRVDPQDDAGLHQEDLDWILDQHPFAHAFLGDAERERESPLNLELNTARAKVSGLSVLIDGSRLGPHEMGTQVTILSLIEALSKRSDVSEVLVWMVNPIPGYAREILGLPKVKVGVGPPEDLSCFGEVDIGHRPFQPDQGFQLDAWKKVCKRVLVSVLDVIPYQIGSYHQTDTVWLEYRAAVRRLLQRVDGVVLISADVQGQIELERLPVDQSRLIVAPNGTDHLTGQESAHTPGAMEMRGLAASEFLLTLGANYTHKNRDLSLLAHAELRRRGWPHVLVLAGTLVPDGSTREYERSWEGSDDVVIMPDVTSEERNWLMRHASVVLYPTSAEGFGFVPYEAARFGTPTVNVSFGPLRETGGHLPVHSADWAPVSLADAVESLLRDPKLAKEQVVAALESGEKYTWAQTAEDLVTAYRDLLSRPPAWSGGH